MRKMAEWRKRGIITHETKHVIDEIKSEKGRHGGAVASTVAFTARRFRV